MTDNLITWNVRNWITVTLMVILGWLVIMALGSIVRGKQPTIENTTGYVAVA